MINIDKEARRIAKEEGLDPDVVKQIIMYQFDFICLVMKDPDDTKDILIHELLRFTLKKRFKENKQANYSPYD